MNRILLILIVVILFQSIPVKAETPAEDIWALATKMLVERIKKNEDLIAEGRDNETDYLVDMYESLHGKDKNFADEKTKADIRQRLKGVRLKGAADGAKIDPYVVIMLPLFQYTENMNLDEAKKLETKAQDVFKMRRGPDAGLMATLLIVGEMIENPAGSGKFGSKYHSQANVSESLTTELKFDVYATWYRRARNAGNDQLPTSLGAPLKPQSDRTVYLTEQVESYVSILQIDPKDIVAPPDENYACNMTLAQFAERKKAERERGLEAAITKLVELKRGSTSVKNSNFVYATPELEPVANSLFVREVMTDKLITLSEHSQYRFYALFIKVDFGVTQDQAWSMAKAVFERSGLGSKDVLMVVSCYVLDHECREDADLPIEEYGDLPIVMVPGIYTPDADIGRRLSLDLSPVHDWKVKFLDGFTAIPKDHIVYTAYYRIDGKMLVTESRRSGRTNNASVVELNFWYDRSALETLNSSKYNSVNITDMSQQLQVVGNYSSQVRAYNDAYLYHVAYPKPEQHRHVLKERYIEKYHRIYMDRFLKDTYPKFYGHDYVISESLPHDWFNAEAPSDPVYAALDIAGLVLSPFGADGGADALGLAYATYKSDGANMALYGASTAVEFVSSGVMRGFIKGAKVVVENKIAYFRSLSDELYVGAKKMLGVYDEAQKKLTVQQTDLVHFIDGAAPSEAVLVKRCDIEKIDIGGESYGWKATAVMYENANKEIVCVIENGFCFPTGTPVIAAEGGSVPIEKVEQGMLVRAYDHNRAKVVSAVVKGTVSRAVHRLTRMVIGGALLFATPEHPLYANDHYIPASELHVGDRVLQDNGAYATVSRVSTYDTTAQVYNLEIAEEHNYFVGDQHLLVHNSCGFLTVREALEGTTLLYNKLTGTKVFEDFHNLVLKASPGEAKLNLFYDQVARVSHKVDFVMDFAGDEVKIRAFFENSKKIDAWEVLSKADVPAEVRAGKSGELDEIARHLSAGKTIDALTAEIRAAGSYAKWLAGVNHATFFLSKYDPKFIDYINQFDNAVYNPQNRTKVWRVMREDQPVNAVIVSKNNTGLKTDGEAFTVEGHVGTGGTNETPYISSFADKDAALKYAADRGGLMVVEIDLTRFDAKLIDLSNETIRNSLLKHPRNKGFAKASYEFLIITNEIPTRAFKPVSNPYPIKTIKK